MSGTTAFNPASTRQDNQVVAMYDTDDEVYAARTALISRGIPESAIQVVAQGRGTGVSGSSPSGTEVDGMWGVVRSLFVPDDDRSACSHAVGRGHAMLVVTMTGGTDRGSVIHALEGTGPIDFDAKLQDWRSSGYDHSAPHPDYLASGQAALGAMPSATPASSIAIPAAPPAQAMPVTGQDTIQVVEESLRVGKREVVTGAVRVRSYVIERPAEAQVRLREEHVTVDRHPVDHPADAAAFQERTIVARAMSEEAVVSKEAHVVEEIALRKEATDRVETVRDTVRRTEVDIEDTVAPKQVR